METSSMKAKVLRVKQTSCPQLSIKGGLNSIISPHFSLRNAMSLKWVCNVLYHLCSLKYLKQPPEREE
jgi:hypothetical protein